MKILFFCSISKVFILFICIIQEKKYLCTAKTVEHSTVFAVELFEIMIIKKRIEAWALKQQGARGGQSGFIILSHQRNRLCPLPLLA